MITTTQAYQPGRPWLVNALRTGAISYHPAAIRQTMTDPIPARLALAAA